MQRKYVGIQGAAVLSGLSVPTIRHLVARGELVAYRPVPGKLVVSVEQLDSYIRSTAGQQSSRGQHLNAE